MMRKLMIGLIVLVVGQGEALAQVSLDSCRRMAIANNKEIIQQQIKIEQAGYQRKQAEAAYLPSLDFEGGYIFNQKSCRSWTKTSCCPPNRLIPPPAPTTSIC